MDEQALIDQDLDMFLAERAWRKSSPRLEEAQWLNIFPQARKQYGKLIKGKLKIEKKYLIERQEWLRQEAIRRVKENTTDNSWRDPLIKEWRDREIHQCVQRIRAIGFLLTLIRPTNKKGNQNVENKKGIAITPEMIARARAYPLEQLVEINRAGFAKCVWHDDAHASMFTRRNFCHCFSCQRSGDTIAVLMQRDGIDFKTAVLKMQ